ncbi:MAG: hypothetical protein H0A76_05720 [Candidatus Thiodubiliella endoseptemdiera]|uniref:Uncharacterized protein n=1 Tax=Candidatus Thiodubiliella endoseptemdiera TaxID=2738886 RepID=A0A853F1J6_9GAMM|nr:hypothetical protein [Candidatus Thiodubiliella endoseptemdiera]
MEVTDDVGFGYNLQGVFGIGGPLPDTVALGHFITDNLILSKRETNKKIKLKGKK